MTLGRLLHLIDSDAQPVSWRWLSLFYVVVFRESLSEMYIKVLLWRLPVLCSVFVEQSAGAKQSWWEVSQLTWQRGDGMVAVLLSFRIAHK